MAWCEAGGGPGRHFRGSVLPGSAVFRPKRAGVHALRPGYGSRAGLLPPADSFAPRPPLASGVLLQVRINSGPPLRLLLDSGASRITLDARASVRSALAAVAESHLVGAGEAPTRPVRSGVAGSVDVGPLQFRNCRVDMAPGVLAEGIDGVIPMSLFGGFLIRLDLPGKALDLTPYPDGAAQPAGTVPAILRDDLLFVRGALNDALEGYILLDTGASYSAVSQRTAKVLRSSPVSSIDLRGAGGAVNGDLITAGVRFQVAGRSFTADPVVALDLAALSALNGVDAIGVLGYPALRASILTVNYRDALVRIDNQSKGGNPGCRWLAKDRPALVEAPAITPKQPVGSGTRPKHELQAARGASRRGSDGLLMDCRGYGLNRTWESQIEIQDD